MEKLKIKVTKEVLEKSKYCNLNKKTKGLPETNCAIALAVRDIFPDAYVAGDEIFFSSGISKGSICPQLVGVGPATKLPKIAKSFIEEFDEATPYKRIRMIPIEFEIKVPASVIDKINIDDLRPLLENHPTLEFTQLTKRVLSTQGEVESMISPV